MKKGKVTKKNTTDTFSYTGKITITVKNGNTVVSKNTYKNNGGLNLWYFLCATLAGQYSNAELFRPTKLMLFNCSSATVPTTEPDFTDTLVYTALTGEVSINKATSVLPIKDLSNKTINYTATLHFLVPPAYFSAGHEELGINTAVLYGKSRPLDITSAKNQYSAYYFFTTKNDDQITWDVANILKIKDIKENYNVIIDWEMSFDNK